MTGRARHKGSKGMLPQENFGLLHLPISILVHSDSILAQSIYNSYR